MPAKKVEKWEDSRGLLHNTKEEAENYEERCNLKDELEALKEYSSDANCDILNEGRVINFIMDNFVRKQK